VVPSLACMTVARTELPVNIELQVGDSGVKGGWCVFCVSVQCQELLNDRVCV
jgi:hypothetical protein